MNLCLPVLSPLDPAHAPRMFPCFLNIFYVGITLPDIHVVLGDGTIPFTERAVVECFLGCQS